MKTIYLIISIFVMTSCDLFKAGSYPYAEYYTFDISREELMIKINEFRDKNPEYKLKRNTDGIGGSGYYYVVYFYLPSEKATIICVINVSNQVKEIPAEIGLTAITYSSNFSGWKRINTKELSKEKNDFIKRIFESEILDKLGKWKKN